MGDNSQAQEMDLEFVFDFDGTITTVDTIARIGMAAVEFQVTNRKRSRSELVSAWEALSASYVQDLAEFHKTYVPPMGQPETPVDTMISRVLPQKPVETLAEVLADGLSGRQRRHVELASLARVKDIGLFEGVRPDDLFNAGQQDRHTGRVRLRKGFDTFFADARQDHDTHVLSASWSDAYITGVLSDYNMTSILANSTNSEDGSIGATLGAFRTPNEEGVWPDLVAVARDKLVVLRHLYWRQKSLKPDKNLYFVYFGDSTTDLECLMEVGGVIMSDDENGTLLTMMRQQLGYHVPHVSEWADSLPICWARDFSELERYNFVKRKVSAAKDTV